MTLDSSERKALRARANSLQVTVTVGKAGITDATMEEIARHLKKNKLIKVRLLLTATEGGATQQAQAEALASQAGADLVEVRGHTAVLWKGRK